MRRLLSFAIAVLFASSAFAQWPVKPVRLISPYPPGGQTDIISRYLADKLQPALGQPVLVENRAGANGIVGIEAAKNSAPDGYTFVYSNVSNISINPPSSLPQHPISAARLAGELRKGGYILYLRHAATDFSQNDAQMSSFEDCAAQRNLLERGREDARRIGTAVRRIGIPIGKVLASPYCRTVETARLAFGRAEKTQEVRGGPAQADDPKRYDALRRLLSTRPAPGMNTVVSSHGNPFHAVAGPPYLHEGEVAVLKPGKDSFTVIARIRLDDWEHLPAARDHPKDRAKTAD